MYTTLKKRVILFAVLLDMILVDSDLRIVNLGTDFSGVIKYLGGEEDVFSDFKISDEVYGQASILSGGSGAFAELALANKGSITRNSKMLNHIEAAGLPLVGVSAWQALVKNIILSKDMHCSY